MATTLAELKKNRKKGFEEIKKRSQEVTKPAKKEYNDQRFWNPTVDKSGSGFAIIRFLDAPKGEGTQWVRYWDHGFKGIGGWYIENSLTSLNEKDPVKLAA